MVNHIDECRYPEKYDSRLLDSGFRRNGHSLIYQEAIHFILRPLVIESGLVKCWSVSDLLH